MHQIDTISLKEHFKHCEDVHFQTYSFQTSKVTLITCDAMIDKYSLNEIIVPRLQSICSDSDKPLTENMLFQNLYLPDLQQITDLNDATTNVFGGFVLIYVEKLQILLSSNIEKKPNRSPEETKLEVQIKGPRDNFIEDLSINIALIRKRLPTDSLAVEKLSIGERSKTKLAILYFQDIADLTILKELKQDLESVSTDVLISSESLMERFNKRSYFLPLNDTTGRPDFAVMALSAGRFVILVDGISYAVITPVNLFLLLKSGEDFDHPAVTSSIERILRILSILIALFLPAFWLALTTFHQEQLPFPLLATIVQANTGLPLPTALEMLGMLLMFELFREAGLRLPSTLGGTISVVGGLIIGDAAIRSGITSPAMIVVIAISTIAGFTLVNQSLVTTVSIMRILNILMTSVFGLFGLFLSLYLFVLYLANLRVYGVPYLYFTADLSWSNLKVTLFRPPMSSYKKRTATKNLQDKTREKE
ncbi:spore germination protein [Solibacillus sp. MA9]|uniref:Spore germination protein n=1 Tax=Solibacillus palustris TaxID=2908203 RepID=A0ABS9UF45_9BACL|nr:spore germination protein [Solibacillus sp. MA9]MCH7322985.1 spore germination protein [Solibacillus sp. MA9]